MASFSSSSTSSNLNKSFKYDVFLSFRAEDTRKYFVDHLYYALQGQGIFNYRDGYRMERGFKIEDDPMKSIEESRFFIIVFSKNYASSSWCLDELVKIMECHKTTNHIAYPVFYNVKRSEVRNQTGDVGESFAIHNNNIERVEKWREALKEAADLSGWELRSIADGIEAKVIQVIVGEISRKLYPNRNYWLPERIPAFSTSFNPKKSFKYDVFLSFRGMDTRRNFAGHLYAALQWQGIHTYMDHVKIERGLKIENELAIEESRFYIIVFSKNYASSSWFLDELVKIMDQCHKTTNHIAFPVFYDVEPSEVRNQTGEVGEAFAIQNNNIERVEKWREALKEAADLSGWDLRNADGHEAIFIQKIVGDISLELRSIPSSNDETLIGMERRMHDLESSLEMGMDDVRMIGIVGIGGVGKTTLARAIFDQISIQFEGKCFVDDVREVSKDSLSGLKFLQEKILLDVLNNEHISINSIAEGRYLIKRKLCGRKVMVVLDDVNNLDQLEALAGASDWFKPGSRIIITTRDEQILMAHGVKQIHHVNLLSNEEAMDLFSRHAFGSTDVRSQESEDLSLEIVRYTGGHPLAIRVLGSSLSGKYKHEWIDALERLKAIPFGHFLEILKLSYRSLEEDYKEIFLDVACFMKGWDRNYAIDILEVCCFHARNGLRVLEKNSLITISNERLHMHDLIQEMGKHIVRSEHPDEPNKHSRLWIREEIEDILANDMGTEATRTIILDSPMKLSFKTVGNAFTKMKNLGILSLVSETGDYYDHDLKIDQAYHNLPNALKYLSWVAYPCRSLPQTFTGSDLVRLDMSDSRIVQLWEGGERKVLKMLRFLNLSYTKLTSLDLGLTPNLERLDLEGCDDLVQLQTPIGSLERLVYLNLTACTRISSFLFIKRLKSLKVLCLTHLFLKEFPDIIPGHQNSRLLELRFRYNDIEELPSLIANLQKLVYLDLHSCRNLKSLPGSICDLRHLRNLKLYGCRLEKLPEGIGRLEWLEKLNLAFTSIKHLPESICMLKNLKTLNLSSCWNLEILPRDLGQLECLQNLILSECTQVREIPDSIYMLKHLKHISLLNCIQIEKLPEALGCLELEVLNVKGTRIKHLPRSIYLLKDLKIYGPTLGPRSRDSGSTATTLEASSIIKQKIDD